MASGRTGGPYGEDVYALAIDATTPDTLYAGTETGGVFKSTDSGSTWAAVNTGLPTDLKVNALALDHTGATTLHAGLAGVGVWKMTFPFFSDGFESGDACGWSAAVGSGCP